MENDCARELPSQRGMFSRIFIEIETGRKKGHFETDPFQYDNLTTATKALPNEVMNVVGILYELADIETVVGRNTGKTLQKRESTRIDESSTCISLTLWNDDIARIAGGE